MFSCIDNEYDLEMIILFIDKYELNKNNIVNICKRHKLENLKNKILQNKFEKELDINDVDLMSGIEFENFLYDIFNKLGYKVSKTKASRDQGIDIIAIKDNCKIGIQAKCYSNSVGNHAIMEAFAGAKYYNCSKCMVITNNYFTSAAKELARSNDIQLWDRDTLIKKINEMNNL